MGFLIDTCIWVDVERGRVAPADVAEYTGDEAVFISPVTIAELAYGVEVAPSEDLRQRRAAALNRLRRKPILIIDEATGDLFGRLAGALKRQGRSGNFRVQDLWLASQAIQHDCSLLTRNGKDFRDIPGLRLAEMEHGRA